MKPTRTFRNKDDQNESTQTKRRVARHRAKKDLQKLQAEGYTAEDLKNYEKDHADWPEVPRLPEKRQTYMDNITLDDLPPGRKRVRAIVSNLRTKKS